MTEFNTIGAGRRVNGARNLNIKAMPKNKIHNEYVNNSDLITPTLRRVVKGKENDHPIIPNSETILPQQLKPSDFNNIRE